MLKLIAGALTLASASSLTAQTSTTDLTYVTPIAGSWRYVPTATGSEVSFNSLAGLPQLTIRCTYLTRSITIVKPAPAAALSLWVWTSLQTRSLPAAFDASTMRVSATVGGFDSLVDAMASSRGRLGFATPKVAPLVVPASGEVSRVVEDCRA